MKSLLDTFVEVKSIFIVGRRWSGDIYGNTYFSAEIYVNDKLVHKIPFCYGYGSQYSWESWNWLRKNGYIECSEESFNYRPYCESKGIEFNSVVSDVKRKRDL